MTSQKKFESERIAPSHVTYLYFVLFIIGESKFKTRGGLAKHLAKFHQGKRDKNESLSRSPCKKNFSASFSGSPCKNPTDEEFEEQIIYEEVRL